MHIGNLEKILNLFFKTYVFYVPMWFKNYKK